jgi:hypothetical protein
MSVVYRTFLEPPATEVDSYVRVTNYKYGEVELKVADCDRRITLAFRKTKAGLRKLAKMERALAEVRAIIETELDL